MTLSWTLARRFAFAIMIIFALCAALLLGISHWATPTVVVENYSSVAVEVEARWDSNRKQLPAIAPGARRSFKVTGESSMAFMVTYPDGRQLTSLPVYFTTTTTVTAAVTDSIVDVSAKL
ncbi:MAG: hypothetical protein ACKVLM_12775 [Pseudomonadales bacterium]